MAESAAATAKSSSSRSVRRSRSAGRSRLGGGGIARLLICAAAALFLAFWSVRMVTVDAVVRRNPFLAAVVAPEHPRVKMALARAEFEIRQGRVSPAARQGAIDALRRSALAEDPFLLSGVQAIADGNPRHGEALLEESRRRNPRSRLTRLLLLDRYLRAGRVDAAGAEMTALTQLVPEAGAALAPGLAGMARDPKLASGTATMLARSPQIRDAVLVQLATSNADPGLILRIAARGAPSAPGSEWQRILTARLVSEGKVAEAYGLWKRFAGASVPAEGKGLYDPRFQGLPGGPPFGWDLAAGGEAAAERAPGGSLQVDYNGRTAVRLARQLTMLKPGAYRLQMRVEGDAKGEGSRLAWNVVCLGSKASLLQIPLVGIDSSPRALGGSFTVPASGCAAQYVSLDGTPGDVPAEQTATIGALELRPAGGR